MELNIKILNEKARLLYEQHGHFHTGDAGLDLYIIEDIEYYDPYELEVNNKEVLITEKAPVLIYIKKL